MWEIFSFASIPYAGMSNVEVSDFVCSGGRLAQPSGCPDVIFMSMKKCWEEKPALRPSFQV